MTRAARKAKHRIGKFGGRVVAGVAGLVAIAGPVDMPIRYPHRSEIDALRGDMSRLGGDLRVVMARHHARLEEIKKSKS